MFTTMRMKNFKSWVDSGDIRLAPLTGFFGTNSSGKSSLLQMLLLLKQTAESNDRKLVLKTGNLQEGYVNLGTVHEIIHGEATDLTLSVGWNLPEAIQIPKLSTSKRIPPPLEIRQLQFSTQIYADTQDIYVKRFSYEAPGFSASMSQQDQERYQIDVFVEGKEPKKPQSRPRTHIARPQKSYGFSDEALLYYQQTEYLSDIVLEFEKQLKQIYYLGPLREYPQRIYTWGGESPTDVGLKGELAIPALLAGKRQALLAQKKQSSKNKKPNIEDKIKEWFKQMGLADSFSTEPLAKGGIQYEARLKRTDASPSVLITDVGFGVSQVLPVLVLCYYAPPGSTLIFEQPELHLHPAVQSTLADVFIDVIQKRQIQIILESHSEHLLRRIQRRIAEETLKTEDTALYFCDSKDGQSTINPLELDVFGNIRNWPHEFFGDLTGELYEIATRGIKRQIQNGNH